MQNGLQTAIERLNHHVQTLVKAGDTAVMINENLEKAATEMLSFSSERSALDWATRIFIPSIAIVAGNYKIESTLKNNLIILSSGRVAILLSSEELADHTRSCDCGAGHLTSLLGVVLGLHPKSIKNIQGQM